MGGAVVYLLFKGQFDATEDQAAKLGVFCTAPSIPNLGLNIFSEAVGTFILVFAIKGKGSSNWGYGVVTLVGPVIGAVAAVLLYGAIPW